MQIHKTAIVEDGAIIGKNVVIEAFSLISKNSIIEDNCVIMQGAQIKRHTKIGKNSKIFPYAVVGALAQDYSANENDETWCIIGENSIIREFVTINSGTSKQDKVTKVGKNCFIMAYSHIAHDCIVGDNALLANNATLAGHVEVGNNSVIGGLTPIHQFVKIGSYCMIAGASAVSQDVPHFCLAAGNHASIRSLNIIGLRRNFEKHDIEEISKAYKEVFRKKGSLHEKAKNILEKSQNEHVKKFCDFILNSQRGIAFDRKSN